MEINREKLAWAAGIFEGEGCFSFIAKSRAISAVVVSTDKDVLDEFQVVIGFGRVLGPYKDGLSHWKPKYRWACSSFEDVQATIALLWPWLKSRRKAKAVNILSDYIMGVPESIKTRVNRNNKIQKLVADGISHQQVCEQFNLSPSRIGQIVWGDDHVSKKQLTADQVEEIRQLRSCGWLQKDLAEKFGCSRPHVSLIVNHKRVHLS